MKNNTLFLTIIILFISGQVANGQNTLPAQIEKQKAKNDSSRMADKVDARLIDLKKIAEDTVVSASSNKAESKGKKTKRYKRKKG